MKLVKFFIFFNVNFFWYMIDAYIRTQTIFFILYILLMKPWLIFRNN
ncbi:unnamed protein product [Musa acuminata subsp. malaccensis]|uniref:(wild Malaysian banana) hypothetical protein n=1 Tax=Musa acuminata subsp. malaccensis TaxID=214687 RepID=A0A804J6T0_MUSAM|nr:unnamed protein product [Musa acuminata subsp. malaccensis]